MQNVIILYSPICAGVLKGALGGPMAVYNGPGGSGKTTREQIELYKKLRNTEIDDCPRNIQTISSSAKLKDESPFNSVEIMS